jgi:hypothetical protein
MHLKRIRWPGLLLGASAIVAVTTVWAQTGGAYDASFNAFDAGGKTVGSGGYVLQTGIGQPLAGSAGGGSYTLNAGVLAGGSGSAAPAPSPSPGAFKRFGPNVASDGVY